MELGGARAGRGRPLPAPNRPPGDDTPVVAGRANQDPDTAVGSFVCDMCCTFSLARFCKLLNGVTFHCADYECWHLIKGDMVAVAMSIF